MVERYSGSGLLTDSATLPEQPITYKLDVWEQFLGGLGGRYKIEGTLEMDSPPERSTSATLILEKEIRLQVRVLPDGKVLGDSGPEFPN